MGIPPVPVGDVTGHDARFTKSSNSKQGKKTMFRSILSVVTGVVVWGLLWVGTGIGLSKAMPDRFAEDMTTTDPLPLGIFIVVSVILSVLAGYLCAAIARRAMMKHVTVLAIIQLLIGIVVQSGVWDLMPVWYHVSFLALVIPGHLVGGWMRAKKQTV